MPTLAELVNDGHDLVVAIGDYVDAYAAWAAGTATGGPNGDGNYPLPLGGGGSALLPCPAKLGLLAGDRPTPKAFGALGNDSADDSTAWNLFIAFLMATGRTGFVTSGVYRVPSASSVSLTKALRLIGEPGAVIDGRGTAAANLFKIVASSVEIEGLEFRSFSDLIVGGNNNEGSFGSTWTGNVDLISVQRCRFIGVRRPLVCRVTDTGPALSNLRLTDNLVDGTTAGWCGFHVAVHNLGAAVVTGNVIRNINATAAGGSPPANIGNGRAILLGGNNPTDTFAHGRWIITGNVIENVTDSRAKASGVNPEVGGIRATGGAYCVVSDNSLSNINSTGTGVDADCEGIYLKTPLATVTGNTLRNAGRAEGSIVIKGVNRNGDNAGTLQARGWGVTVANNVLWTNFGGRTVGIGVQTSHCLIEGNTLIGFGGDSNRWVPILLDAAQQDETKIRGNRILDTVGRFGLRVIAYGRNIEITGNTIQGVTGAALAAPAQTYGISVDNTDGNGTNLVIPPVPLENLRIERNTIAGVVTMSGQSSKAIAINSSASDCNDLTVAGNVVRGTTSTGIALSGASFDFNRVQVLDNDLRRATDPWSVSGTGVTVSDLTARGNRGWLYTEVVVDPPNITAGTETYFDVAMDDLATRDFVQVGWSGPLAQTVSSVLINLRVDWEIFKPDLAVDAYVVRIYLRNPNASSLNIGSRTWYVRVEKQAA